MSKVLVISTSLRARSNSDILADRVIEGARDAGHEVEKISLKGKEIKYCVGCLSCVKTGKCPQRDDAAAINEKIGEAETIVFATPIYYYGMSGQMKTMLDRTNPLYKTDYKFRRIYLLSVAAEDEKTTPEKTENGLLGWVDCYEKAKFCGSLFCGGIDAAGEAADRKTELKEAYEFGKALL